MGIWGKTLVWGLDFALYFKSKQASKMRTLYSFPALPDTEECGVIANLQNLTKSPMQTHPGHPSVGKRNEYQVLAMATATCT